MKLSKEELINKFPYLKKYDDKNWISRLVLSQTGNLNDIPFTFCKILFDDLLSFLEQTRFSSKWEENFSTKVRVKQMIDILYEIQNH